MHAKLRNINFRVVYDVVLKNRKRVIRGLRFRSGRRRARGATFGKAKEIPQITLAKGYVRSRGVAERARITAEVIGNEIINIMFT